MHKSVVYDLYMHSFVGVWGVKSIIHASILKYVVQCTSNVMIYV